MKVNSWSIVRSPVGISAKPLTQHTYLEVCLSIEKGKLHVSVHRDGQDPAFRVFKVAIKPPKLKKRIIKHAPGAVRAINQLVAEQEFNKGNEHRMWLYLLAAEFYEGEVK